MSSPLHLMGKLGNICLFLFSTATAFHLEVEQQLELEVSKCIGSNCGATNEDSKKDSEGTSEPESESESKVQQSPDSDSSVSPKSRSLALKKASLLNLAEGQQLALLQSDRGVKGKFGFIYSQI